MNCCVFMMTMRESALDQEQIPGEFVECRGTMPQNASDDITRILAAAADCSDPAAEQILPFVYDELRKLAHHHMAKEPAGHTLTATALVHEAYVRLIGVEEIQWNSRRHFFAAAARAMRRILIDRARKRSTVKHGGAVDRIDLGDVAMVTDTSPSRFLDLDAALSRLEQFDARKGEVVMLRFFGGLTIEETALSLGISNRLVTREWTFARAWLKRELDGESISN